MSSRGHPSCIPEDYDKVTVLKQINITHYFKISQLCFKDRHFVIYPSLN